MSTIMNYDLFAGEGVETATRMKEKPLTKSERLMQDGNYRASEDSVVSCNTCQYHVIVDTNDGNAAISRPDWRHKCKRLGLDREHHSANDIDLFSVCNYWKKSSKKEEA